MNTEQNQKSAGLELWLVRHGETDWNREGRSQGHSQNPLSERGVKQARRLGVRLAAETFDTVYSSDLRRALQTAQLVFPGETIIQDTRLREISRGVLEGTTDATRTEEQRELLRYIREDRLNRRPPGGENFQDVTDRVASWLADLPREGRIIAFSHGGTIRSALCYLFDLPHSFPFALNNTGLTRLILAEGAVTLSFVNDHAHVRGLEELWSY